VTGAVILVVEDDPSSLEYAALALEQAHFSIRKASDGIEALRAIEREVPSLVISDIRMPGMDGLELLSCIRERWPSVPVIMVTVEGDIATIVSAVQQGAVNYLVKPVSPPVLVAAATKALARAPPAAVDTAHEIVGASPTIVRVRHLVALASRSDVNVFVFGETGTGKELVARAVHRLSGQAQRSLVAHNCALTPPDMFDSEFFGHLRGAFTGAHRDRPGLLRQAEGGVLFLDELECLSLQNQAKLLRVLDDGEVRPVGADRAVVVSVRYVAATNRLPEEMIVAGELREDLYYRLRGFEIRLPPLRDRLEDIPLLAEHFLGNSGKRLTAGAADALQRCLWPGNVRQLRTVLQCAAARASGSAVDLRDLDLEIPGGLGVGSMPPSSVGARGADPADINLEKIEREAILRALALHGGNRSRAAQALGIHRSTLLRRIHELGIPLSGQKKRRARESD
jgi:DNA-binding NtrC family response regulator